MFASAATTAQLASSLNKPIGLWVKLCATGAQAFIPLGLKNDNDPDSPAPGHHSQACHACADRRFGGNTDDGEGNDDMPAP